MLWRSTRVSDDRPRAAEAPAEPHQGASGRERTPATRTPQADRRSTAPALRLPRRARLIPGALAWGRYKASLMTQTPRGSVDGRHSMSLMVVRFDAFYRFCVDVGLKTALPIRTLSDAYLSSCEEELGPLHHLTKWRWWEALVRLALALHLQEQAQQEPSALSVMGKRNNPADVSPSPGGKNIVAVIQFSDW